jgi:hypothetical protein
MNCSESGALSGLSVQWTQNCGLQIGDAAASSPKYSRSFLSVGRARIACARRRSAP